MKKQYNCDESNNKMQKKNDVIKEDFSFEIRMVIFVKSSEKLNSAESMFKIVPWSYLPNPSARAGYDTRTIFKRSLAGLNSEFSFS